MLPRSASSAAPHYRCGDPRAAVAGRSRLATAAGTAHLNARSHTRMSTRAFTTATLVVIAPAAAAMLAATFAVTREPPIRAVRVGQAVAERTRHAGVAVGPADAPVVVRIFSDFQCAACR